VDVSSDEDDVPKKSISNDARDGGASSARPITPNLIRSNALGPIGPFITDRAATTDPPMGEHRHERPWPF
jgi:hypothetical protein